MPRYVPVVLFLACTLLLFFALTTQSPQDGLDSAVNLDGLSSTRLEEAIAENDALAGGAPTVVERDAIATNPVTTVTPAANPANVIVTVLLPDGTPAPGATLYHFDSDTDVSAPSAAGLFSVAPSLLKISKLVGTKYTTDALGVAILPPLPQQTDLIASYGEYFSSYWYRDKTSVTITLEKDRTFDVRLVSSSGQSTAGIDVGLFRASPKQELRWPETTARADADGAVTFGQFDDLFRFNSRSETVAVLALFTRTIRKDFDYQNLPQEAIELIVPAFGSIVGTLTGADKYPTTRVRYCDIILDTTPTPGRTLEELRMVFEDYESLELGAQFFSESVQFPCVGLNQSFVARVKFVDPLDSVYLVFEGPKEAGEEVQIELKPTLAPRPLKLPVFNAIGKPVIEEALTLELHQVRQDGLRKYSNDRRFSTTTDANGLLDMAPWSGFLLGNHGLETVQIRAALLQQPLHESQFGELLVHPIQHAESNFLEPMKLQHIPMLVAGRVIGLTPAQSDELKLTVQNKTAPEYPSAFPWSDLGHVFTTTEGYFAFPFPQIPPAGQLRIIIPHNVGAVASISFEAGETDLEIDLSTDYFLDGSLTIPEELKDSDFRVTFTPLPTHNHRWQTGVAKVSANLHFQIASLANVVGVVQISTTPGYLPLLSIENVLPHRSGETSDARLNPMDLNSVVKFFEVDVIDTEGIPVDRGYLEGIGDSAGLWVDFRSGKELKIPSASNTLHANVWASGFAKQAVELVPGSNAITLAPGISVHATIVGAHEIPQDLKMTIELHATGKGNFYFGKEEQEVPASGIIDFQLPVSGTFIYSVKIWRDEKFLTGYRLNDPEDEIIIVDTTTVQNIRLTLPLEQLLADLEDN